jgi:hypothetical protein
MEKPQRHQDTKDFGLRPLPADLGPLSRVIVDAAFKVHNILGPGLLESQLSLPVFYDGVSIETGLRIDLIVDRRIIVELKAAEIMHPIYTAQLLTRILQFGINDG